LKVTTETVATREVLLTIEPNPQDVQKALRKAARQISRLRPLRGYRPGKAPYGLIERIYGHETILDEAINDMAPALYREAIEETSIEPYQQGRLEVESRDPVVLKVNVPLVPVVTLGDYRSLQVDPEPEVAVTEEHIDRLVEVERRRQAQSEAVDRPVQLGDRIVASVTGVSAGETVIDNEDISLDIEDALPPPGFAEALVGMNQDETREFSLTYPDDYDQESLAGKNVSFTVTVTTVHQVLLPEIDDDLAKAAGDYETLAELRDSLAASLKRRLEGEARAREAEAAIEALVAQATVDYPTAAVEREVDVALDDRRARLQRMGLDFERYLQLVESTEQQLREELRPEAERTLVRRLVLAEFASAEELNVDADDLAAGLARVAAVYGEDAPELQDTRVILSIRSEMLHRKAASHLTAMLTGRLAEEEATPEEASLNESDSDDAGPQAGPQAGHEVAEAEEAADQAASPGDESQAEIVGQ